MVNEKDNEKLFNTKNPMGFRERVYRLINYITASCVLEGKGYDTEECWSERIQELINKQEGPGDGKGFKDTITECFMNAKVDDKVILDHP